MTVTPEEIRAQFATVFAELDASPRKVRFKVFAPGITLDLVNGEPVFRDETGETSAANFRGRWLAEHEVPMSLGRRRTFRMIPSYGNRLKVRVR